MSNKRKIVFILCTLFICVFLSHSRAFAAEETYYVDEYNNRHTLTEYETHTGSEDTVTLGKSGTVSWYVLKGDVTFKKQVFIAGTVNIVLFGNSVVNCEDGIVVEDSDKFVLWGQAWNSGRLTATGDYGDAGIGSREDNKCGTIEIHSGWVKGETSGIPYVNRAGAGIGSGASGKPGTIHIFGGDVNGEGGHHAAGIGGGYKCESGDITISGGDVFGGSEQFGAGIGSGDEASYENRGKIILSGGSIIGYGGEEGAGIGGGNEVSGGIINIKGNPRITAVGGKSSRLNRNGAGIGGGDIAGAGDITIEGGNITANGGDYAAGIGTGDEAGDKGGTISISGGTIIATGGSDGAGIGGGNESKGCKVTISGGTVTATGSNSPGLHDAGGAGIGGGDAGDGGQVYISGGHVTANGGADAAGIGGGDGGKGGYTEISGNAVVTAAGIDGGAGIGSGEYDSETGSGIIPGGTTKIFGGTVTATGGGLDAELNRHGGAGIGSGQRAKKTDANEKSAIVEIIEKDNSEIHVTAQGGFYGAGIGGGGYGNGADVTIDIKEHSKVKSTGGEFGAGIGSGREAKNSGILLIKDGTVETFGGDRSAGIGGGFESNSHAVTINGGNVYAEGGDGGAGIGGGEWGDQVGAVTINGGTVRAFGFGGGAGIGGGDEELLGEGGAGGKVIVGEDATVVAGTDKSEAMPIGNGEDDTNTLYGLTISNTAKVRAGTSEKKASLQTRGNRISACHNRENGWVKIEKCGHESTEYTAIDTREHRVRCKHCYLDDTENHTIEGHICTKCGYGAYQVTYDPANGTDPWVDYKEPQTDEQGNLLPWEITLPAEPQAPEDKIFGGWFIDDDEEPEKYYAAGSEYSLTKAVRFKASWESPVESSFTAGEHGTEGTGWPEGGKFTGPAGSWTISAAEDQDGSGTVVMQHSHGITSMTVIASPKEGYLFDGVKISVGDSSRIFKPGDEGALEIGENASVEFIWIKARSLTINWSSMDDPADAPDPVVLTVKEGTTISDALYDADITINKPPFTKDGYVSYNLYTPEPIGSYPDYDAMAAADTDKSAVMTDDVTLYYLMAKLIDSAELTIDPPLCGTAITTADIDHPWNGQTDPPQITAKDGAHYNLDTHDDTLPAWWIDASTQKGYNGSMTGGESYQFAFSLVADLGYKFAVEEEAITINGGTLIRKTSFRVEEYLEGIAAVTADHAPGAAARENEISATCTEDGSYDDVVRCRGCNQKQSSEHVIIPALGHAWSEWSESSTTPGTVHKERTCSRCPEKEEYNYQEGHDHDPWVVVGQEATCTDAGIVLHFQCISCGKLFDDMNCTNEITEEDTIIPALGHEPRKAVKENETAAGCVTAGSYDEVVYCNRCGEELSRTHVVVDALGHDYGDWVVSKAPTCTGKGKETRVCSRCEETEKRDVDALGHTEEVLPAKDATCTETGLTEGKKCSVCGTILVAQEEIPALGHKEVAVAGKAATCTKPGLTEGKKCSVCGEITVAQEEIPALGHTEEVVPAQEADCTEPGLTEGKKCSVCGEVLVEQEETPALGHDWGEWERTKEPTCTKKGRDTRECSRCHDTETRSIAALGHTEEVLEAKEATCTETGLTEGKKCSVCGEILVEQEEIAALGHSWGEWTQTTTPTCTDKGEETRECSRCHEKETREVDALGHKEETIPGKAATCTEPGLTEGKKCSVCGEILEAQKEIAALGHSWGRWAQTTAPTCTDKGEETRECSRCHEKETREVDALGHKEETIPGKAATCTEPGLTEGKKCSVCGEILEAQKEIAALGHSWGRWMQTTAPTCTEKGVETRECSRCHEKETRDVDALGHSWGRWAQTTAPTCTDKGVETRECSRCHEKETRDVDALGHTEETVPGKAATCTETGLTVGKKCSVCGEILVEQKEIAALGHNWGSWTETIAPTCTDKGVETRECFRCHEKETRDVDPLGHKEETVPGKAATCTEPGLTEGKKCSVCGSILEEQKEIKPLGHDFGGYKLTRVANTSKSGLLTQKCSRCGKKVSTVIAPIIAKATVTSGTGAKITWTKVPQAERYLVYFGSCKGSVSKVASVKTLSYTVKKLKKGNYYKFKIRAQRKINGKWTTISTGFTGHFVAGDLNKTKKYTNVKSISVKKTAVTLKAGRTSTVKPRMKMVKTGKKVLTQGHAKAFRYLSTNTDVATVSSKGKITAKKAGTCKVYVVGVNGVYKAIKVIVK